MLDVLIIGAGPAGLFAAEHLSATGLRVTVADRMPSPARKFLMAGRGGLNITHSEPLPQFMSRYRDAEPFLQPIVAGFPPADLIAWCNGLGQETFTGTSGRVFPKAMKASPLLRAWLRRLSEQGVDLLTRKTFCGFDTNVRALLRDGTASPEPIAARAVLLALGGASWPKLGSDASWVPALEEREIRVQKLQPANCGFLVDWSPFLKARFAGYPLKRIRITCSGTSVSGEAVLSEKGLEGGAVYALSAEIRNLLSKSAPASIQIDLRPQMSVEQLTDRLNRPRGKQSTSTFLKKSIKLQPVEQALLREAGPLPDSPAALAMQIKSVPVLCSAPYPMDRAISSAGGIALDELDDNLMLKKLPGVFAAGEMLDWEAPTGGYLLQACFATGKVAAQGIATFLAAEPNESPLP